MEAEICFRLELPQAEVKKILDALMKEASTNLAQAKQDMVAFVAAKIEPAGTLLVRATGDGAPSPLLVFVHGGYWQALSAAASLYLAPGALAAVTARFGAQGGAHFGGRLGGE